jgi:arylsulfatase A-like enzyme
MDAQLGRVLAELDRLKLRDNTIIVLWSDHGYQLGEHTLWAKHTNYETSTRVPLIVSVPKQRERGAKANQLAELVDVYPTLCEAAGLPIPKDLAGESLLSVVRDVKAPGQTAAFSQYPRGAKSAIMGYSMRTDRFRFTEWVSTSDGSRQAVELYDHQLDPHENQNVAARPEHRDRITEMSRQLRAATPPVLTGAPAPAVQTPAK